MTKMFHKFIEVAAEKPQQVSKLAEFLYMQHDIRKTYKQFKDNKGVVRPGQDFILYWKQIGKQGVQVQVQFYFKWIELLRKALQPASAITKPLADREAELYVKKSMIGSWDRRRVKLLGLNLWTYSKHTREYPLRCFVIRKSKNKEHFSCVLEVIMQIGEGKLKSFHIGTNNIIQYQEWYQDIEERINIARVQFFRQIVNSENPLKTIEQQSQLSYRQKTQVKKQAQENPPLSHRQAQTPNKQLEQTPKKQLKSSSKQSQRQKEQGALSSINQNKFRQKTLTELVIDKQMNGIEDFQHEQLQLIQESQQLQIQDQQIHPNVFKRLFPDKDLLNFNRHPSSLNLLEEDSNYTLYQINQQLKIFITINHNISKTFRAISQSHKQWNTQIDLFTIKNKLSSQNSILVYQKDKAKGFLYRQRDYLFLRHCFSIPEQNKQSSLFMVEKSIDSIHTPPFMTVARGEQQLIWALTGKSTASQCQLVVQGLIKGGGYMGQQQNRQTTIKYMKKLLVLNTYLNNVSYNNNDAQLFRERWVVNLKQQEDEFEDPITHQEHEEGNAKGQEKAQSETTKRQEQQKYKQFIKGTTAQNFDDFKKQVTIRQNIGSQDLSKGFIRPQFDEQNCVVIPQNYIKKVHRMTPKPKKKQVWGEVLRGHHLWRGEWAVAEAGGLNYVDQEKMREQKKVLTFIIKRIGKNILSGKGILNISLPVDIFCRQSNIQRLAMSFGYAPVFLQKVAHEKDPIQQLKAIVATSCGSSLIYLTMQKPFNPILGETYQSWIDGCPVYFQQISHHPPIAAYMMKGRGFTISGTVQAKMDLSINSGTGINEGIFTVNFDNGRTFYYTTPPGQLNGLTYGERKLLLVNKTFFWNIDEGLFMQVNYNILSKQKGFFGGGGKNLVGQERLADYCEGILRKYNTKDLQEFLAPKKNDSRKIMALPKGCPTAQPIAEVGKLRGRWTKYIQFEGQKVFDVDKDNYMVCCDEKTPLPSHSNYREDIVYRRMGNVVSSQQFKQILQVKQRKDRKLREDYKKKYK